MSDIVTLRDIVDLLIGYLRGVWRHRWHMVMTAWVVCLAGWSYVFVMQDIYTSQGTILLVDPQGLLSPYLANSLDVTVEAQKIVSRVTSRNVLLQVIQQTDLTKEVKRPEDLEPMLAQLQSQIANKNSRSASDWTFTISHSHPNPRIAHQVATILVDTVLKGTIRRMTADKSRKTEAMLDEQIKNFETEVADAQAKLRIFVKEYGSVLPGPGGYYDQLQGITTQLDREKTHLRETEKKREEMMRQLNAMGAAVPLNGDASRPAIEQKIKELTAMLDERRNKFYIKNSIKRPLYLEDHAEMVALKRTIASLEQQRKSDQEGVKPHSVDSPPPGMENDPGYRRIKSSLGDLEGEVVATNARIEEKSAQLAEMQRKEASLTWVEVDHIRLQRNLSMAKSRLLALVSSEGEVKMTGDIAENLSEKVSFELMSSPSLPTKPAAPNRRLFNAVVLAGGAVAGLFLSLFLAFIHPVFDNPVSLKKELGLPVLGTVSIVGTTGRHWILANRFGFWLSLAGLLGCFAALSLPILR